MSLHALHCTNIIILVIATRSINMMITQLNTCMIHEDGVRKYTAMALSILSLHLHESIFNCC